MWYDIDYKQLAICLLPTFERKKIHIHWLWVLLAPLIDLQTTWKLLRESNLYRLENNGQVCYLRRVLNDQFDPDFRRIYINDGLRYQRKYIYTKAEQRLKTIYTHNEVVNEDKTPFYLRPSTDFIDTGVDFIVWVPIGLEFNDFDMRRWIDNYKLASKRYKIEFYET